LLIDIHEYIDGQTLTADLCIIGAGAAGISLALKFLGSGINVLLLESGGLKAERATQALYRGSVADERLHSPPERYRQRCFGGTTTIWGGRCMPLDDIDFEVRDYVPHSGWPITGAELLPFYKEANDLCEAGRYSYDAATALPASAPPMLVGFDSPNFSTDHLERFSCPTDFGRRYRHSLSAASNVRVVLHANVTAINLDQSGAQVISASVASLRGRRITAVARQFVVAAGGLETARLLLSSADVQAQGIGNQCDVLGRYYMCHIAGTIGTIRIEGPLSRVHHGYDLSEEGIYCRRRLAVRPEVQRRLHLGNFVARLHHPRITDPEHRNAVLSALFLAKFMIPYEYGKRLHGGETATARVWTQHVRNVMRSPADAVAFAWHMLFDRKLAKRKFPSVIVRPKANLYSLEFHGEQYPNPESRVKLDTERDALGMRRLHVDWRYTEADVDTTRRTLALLASDLQCQRIGRFDFDPHTVEAEMTRYGAFGGHHLGTARMGSDPRSSVVNANCRVYGTDNLYIASSAVFPTSSQANPTLTVVALALRLAGHLQLQLCR
jgi:choline dehydrogenase-like flavoprotein